MPLSLRHRRPLLPICRVLLVALLAAAPKAVLACALAGAPDAGPRLERSNPPLLRTRYCTLLL